MKFKCALYVVKDIEKSRLFYEGLLNQKVKYDFGENITYHGDFSIQELNSFSELTSIKEEYIIQKTNNSELYFETDNIEDFIEKLEKKRGTIEYIHDLIKHPWGQRVLRVYDPDMHIVEVGESMESVIKRFLLAGHSIGDTVKITQHPLELVESVAKSIK